MTIPDIFFLLGGLGLFLYGIHLMSNGLSLVAGSKLKNLLGKLTHNKWMGALLGFVVTAIVQSSTATTVMTIGFIDSSLMTLTQATGVIMGANVGTTLTGILFTFNIQDIVPFIIFLGTMAMLFIQRKVFRHTGMILLGFGILFLGLNLMSSAMSPLRESAFIGNLFTYTQMPIIGLLVGFAVTALIQSSTASIGILLSMVAVGVVTDLNQAIFILYGFNVGTVITVLIASIKANKASKQAAVVHVLFNVLGALMFTIITILPLGFVDIVKSMSDTITLQLVYAHIIFNVATMLILLPFSKYIVWAAKKTVRKGSEDGNELRLKYIDRVLVNTPAIGVEYAYKETERMCELAFDYFRLTSKTCDTNKNNEGAYSKSLAQNKKVITYLNKEVEAYLTELDTHKLDDRSIITMSICYKSIDYLKRIQVLSKKLSAYIHQCKHEEKCSDSNMKQVDVIVSLVEEIMSQTLELFKDNQCGASASEERVQHIRDLNDKISHLTQTTEESLLAGITYTRILSLLGRISANTTFIAEALEHRS